MLIVPESELEHHLYQKLSMPGIAGIFIPETADSEKFQIASLNPLGTHIVAGFTKKNRAVPSAASDNGV
ncbi:uncharacterized protein FFB14_15073 [Fusarium fujikuroi]|nr:uncharacterized protein FFB14_15073 [Fusarium fujikuroi]